MSVNLSLLKQVREILNELLEKMGIKAAISTRATEKFLFVDISDVNPDSKILIGRNGEVLLALQLILSMIVIRKLSPDFQIILDIEGYRQKREKALIAMTHRWAKQVLEKHDKLVLSPMRPFERRIVHITLQDEYPALETNSIGDDPYRQVVISSKKNE